MKQFTIKISAVIMALVVFLSTMSFTIDMHYCGGILVDVGLFSHAESCGMEMEESSSSDCEVSKNNCCSDEHIVIEGQDELHFYVFEYSFFNQELYVASFIDSYVNLIESLQDQFNPFEEYLPPIVVADIQVLHQVYRI